jgi:hypothetical protein
MLLTRRADLLIEEVKEDLGMDYLVRFQTPGKDGLREFGVGVRGAWAAVDTAGANEALALPLKEIQHYGPFLRPVCLFLFSMEGDGGWYTWVSRPLAGQEGVVGLASCREPDCEPLDRKALKEILECVDRWYDAIFPRVVTNGGARKSGPKRVKP